MHSFAPGTLVLLADGSKRPIEKLKPGDKVLATDPDTGHTTAQAVVATHTNVDAGRTHLTLETNNTHALIQTTAHHPFWSPDRATWTDAAELRAGERLLTPNGPSPTVTTVQSHAGPTVMYDLTIATIHTYYVIAGTTPVLVHNVDACGIGSPTEPRPKFRKGTVEGAWNDAEVGSNGGRLCPTCDAGGQRLTGAEAPRLGY